MISLLLGEFYASITNFSKIMSTSCLKRSHVLYSSGSSQINYVNNVANCLQGIHLHRMNSPCPSSQLIDFGSSFVLQDYVFRLTNPNVAFHGPTISVYSVSLGPMQVQHHMLISRIRSMPRRKVQQYFWVIRRKEGPEFREVPSSRYRRKIQDNQDGKALKHHEQQGHGILI